MAVKWSIWDKIIASLRYSKVRAYILDNSILCDLGCGFNGAFLLTQSNRIAKGYGFDKKVTSELLGNIYLQSIENIEKGIPLESNSVNCITMLALLEHLNDYTGVLKEALRILEPGGRVLLTTPTPAAQPVLEFLAFKLGIISRDEIEDHKRYFNRKELVKALEEAGYNKCFWKSFQFGFNQLAIAYKPAK